VQETLEEGVGVDGGGLHVAGDEDGDDEGVDGDDSGHYYWDETLSVAKSVSVMALVYTCGGDGGWREGEEEERTFIIRSDLKVPTPAMPMPDLAVP